MSIEGGGGKKCIYVAAGLEKGGDAGQKGGVECALWMSLVGAIYSFSETASPDKL